MDILTTIVGIALLLMLTVFLGWLSYAIVTNLINGRKFHESLEQQLHKLRLSKMLDAFGINKTAYIYQTSVKDIHQQMNNCSACTNTDECDEQLSAAEPVITNIEFCNNEAELKEIKQQLSK